MNFSSRNVLVIGASGKQAREYVTQLDQSTRENYRFAGVDPHIAGIPADDFSLGQFESIDSALLAHPYDFAILAVPHAYHFQIATKIINHGIPLIKEKPLALNALEAEYLNALSHQKKAPLYVTAQRPWSELWIKTKALLNELHPYFFNYEMSFAFSQLSSGWRAQRELSRGGTLLDMGYHAVDLLVFLWDEVKRIDTIRSFAYSEMERENLEDSASAILEFKNGINGNLMLHRHHTRKIERLEILCSEGVLKVKGASLRFYSRSGKLEWQSDFDSHLKVAASSMLHQFAQLAIERIPHHESRDRALLTTNALDKTTNSIQNYFYLERNAHESRNSIQLQKLQG